MEWKKYITSDPGILGGKPHIAGTRLTIEFVLSLFGNGWTREQVMENYPSLGDDQLNAVFSFAAEILHDEALFYLKKSSHEISC